MKIIKGSINNSAIGLCYADFNCYHLGPGWTCYYNGTNGTCSHP